MFEYIKYHFLLFFNDSIILLTAVITNHEIANGLRKGWTEQEICAFAIKKFAGKVIDLEQLRKRFSFENYGTRVVEPA